MIFLGFYGGGPPHTAMHICLGGYAARATAVLCIFSTGPELRAAYVDPAEGNLKGSATAADPLVGQVPLVVDMTLRGGDMTLRDKILEGQSWGP